MIVTTASGEYTPEDKTILDTINNCGEKVFNGKESLDSYLMLVLNAASAGIIHTIETQGVTFELNVEVLETK
jgi:hypothetical protein